MGMVQGSRDGTGEWEWCREVEMAQGNGNGAVVTPWPEYDSLDLASHVG